MLIFTVLRLQHYFLLQLVSMKSFRFQSLEEILINYASQKQVKKNLEHTS